MTAFTGAAQAQVFQPGFSKVFSPDNIGAGSTTTLTFTIDNSANVVGVDTLAFVDAMPAGMTVADSASTSTCGGTLTATSGLGTISLADGLVGAGNSCVITVKVTTSSADTYKNTTGDLTSSAGNSETATDTLITGNGLPGFSKVFSPSSVALGGTSTLTFTMDSTLSESSEANLQFTDNLPAGIQVASPANAATTCGTTTFPPVLTATPGSSVITLNASGFLPTFPALPAGSTCTVTVDVTGTVIGIQNNVVELLADFESAGFAAAQLEVTGAPAGTIQITKSFTNDPVAPGGTVVLDFTLQNTDRDFAATAVAFSDDLAAMLGGTIFTSVNPNDCGATVSGTGTSTITVSGGAIPALGSCMISTTLTISGAAALGSHTNTTDAVTATINGAPVTGNQASNNLTVQDFAPLTFTKTFLDNPVGSGGSTTLRFEIANPNVLPGNYDATGINFTDELTTFLPSPISATFPAAPCGVGSSINLSSLGTGGQGVVLANGNLVEGASCTFDVEIDIPVGVAPGTFTNTTSQLEANLGDAGAVVSPAASDSLTIVGPALSLTKEFIDDPAIAGSTTTLRFTLENGSEALNAVSGVTFTDDLNAMLATTSAVGLPLSNVCGAGNGTITGSASDTFLTLAGVTLAVGETCVIDVTLDIPPAGPAGSFANTTSDVAATILGQPFTASGSSDTLVVQLPNAAPIVVAKTFLSNPAVPGETTIARFTLTNPNTDPGGEATNISLTDNFASMGLGLAGADIGAVANNTCAPAPTNAGTTTSLAGASLGLGASCSFDIPITVPTTAVSNNYRNTTSAPSATIGGNTVTGLAAEDVLAVLAEPLALTKSLPDTAVLAGTNAVLEFTITNLSSLTATNIAFSDDLDAMLTGATAESAISDDCGGTASFPVPTFAYIGGSLTAGQSCTISINVAVPGTAGPGSFLNQTSTILGDFGTVVGVESPEATDTLLVTTSAAPIFTKAFSPDTVNPSDTTDLTFTITNVSTTESLSALRFADDLDAMITGATATSLVTASPPCGVGSTLSGIGSSSIDLDGGVLDPSGSCTFTVRVLVPESATAPMNYTNETSDLTSGVTVLAPLASASLQVNPFEADLGVTLTDSPDPVLPDGTLAYTMTVSNAGPNDALSVVATITLPAGVTLADTVGCAEDPAGVPTCTLGTIATAANKVVTINTTVDSGTTGILNASASVVTATSDPVAGNNLANASTTVTPSADISVTKTDGVTSVLAGETLTYTIVASNAGPSTATATLTDTLPGELSCTYTSVAAGGATGQTPAGAGDLAETLTMPKDSSVIYTMLCAVDAATAATTLTNTATVASSVGDPDTGNNSATDDDTAVSVEADIEVTKDDGLTSVAAGTTLTYTIAATNLGPSNAPSVALTDTLPTDLTCTYTSAAAGGATGNTTAGSGDLNEALFMPAGSSVTYSASCTVSTLATGTLSNTATATSTTPDPNAANNSATDDDTVVMEAVIGFEKEFADATIEQGQETTLTFTIDNSANAVDATDLVFSDDFNAPSVSGLVVASPLTVSNGCGGTFAPAVGDTLVDLDLGMVGAGAQCEISVLVRALLPGTINNTTSTLTSNLPTAAQATDTLTVNAAAAPLFSKEFAPDAIDQGGLSVLTLSIDNSANAIEAASLAFTDTFPTGLVVATTPAVTNSCGGTVTAAAGSGSLTLAGGTVAATSTCEISVTTQALEFGTLNNVTSTLTSTLGDAAPATATLNSTAVPLTLSMAFSPPAIEQFQTSAVTFAMRNTAAIAASSIILTDDLPADVTIASIPAASTSCVGGTLSAPAGGSTISYSGGGLAAGDGCSITVNVTSSVVGTYPDTTEAQSSSLGTSTAASASLTVDPALTGTVTFVQNSDTDGSYAFTSTETLLNFFVDVIGGTGSFGPVTLAVGSYMTEAAPPTGVALTAISCDDTDSTGDPTTRMLTLNIAALENVTCTLTSESSLQKTVDTINRFLTKRADLILSSEPDNRRRFDRLRNGFGNANPLTFSTGNLQSMLPFTAQVTRGSGNYRFSTSLLQVRQAAASIELAHGATKNAIYVENYRFDAWFEAQYKKFDANAQGEGHFAIAYMGADYLLTPNVLIGALVSIDDMQDDSSTLGTSASGTGWMVGPYITAKLAPNLYFDGRIAAGRSNNKVSPFNTYVDDFTTSRWMAVAGLTGDFQRGPWTIQPNAYLSYIEEKQDSYVDSVGSTIPSQTVRLGQLQVGPTFTGHFEGDDGTFYAPYFSVDAIYNIGDTTGVTITNPSTPATEGWRARLKAGVNMTTETGVQIGFGGTYDGIGRDDFEVWGLSFDLTIPLSKPKAR